MKEAFLQSIREEYPNEEITRSVFADWCAENEPELEHKLRRHIPPIDNLRILQASGDGYRIFDEEIATIGYGLSYLNNGWNGNHYYWKHGFGFGIPYQNPKLNMPKLYENQLIFLPYGIIFCGYVAEQLALYQFRIDNASMLVFNSYRTWEVIAKDSLSRGKNLIYRKFGPITIGPQIFHSIKWEGELL